MDHQGDLGQNCHVEPVQKVANLDDMSMARIVGLEVFGMGCINCTGPFAPLRLVGPPARSLASACPSRVSMCATW
jgi:hypothetical protein